MSFTSNLGMELFRSRTAWISRSGLADCLSHTLDSTEGSWCCWKLWIL